MPKKPAKPVRFVVVSYPACPPDRPGGNPQIIVTQRGPFGRAFLEAQDAEGAKAAFAAYALTCTGEGKPPAALSYVIPPGSRPSAEVRALARAPLYVNIPGFPPVARMTAAVPGEACTYPQCKCVVQTSTSRPEPDCPRGLRIAA
jgi:hypothetical protein